MSPSDEVRHNVFENPPEKKNVQLLVHEVSQADMVRLSEEELYVRLKEQGFDSRRPITVREDPVNGSRTFVQGES